MKIRINRRYFKCAIWACTAVFMILYLSCQDRKKEEQLKAKQSSFSESVKDSSYIVEVIAADYAFGMPTEIPSGWVTFRMENLGQEVHNAVIQKYSDSLTYQELAGMVSKALEEGQVNLPPAEKPMGGPAMLSPGLTGETTIFLEPGVYGMFCFMVAKDGEVHFSKGMARPFIVNDEQSSAKEPEGTVDVVVSDRAIDIEDPIEAGDIVFDVHFQTPQNVHLAKLSEGQSLEDLKEWMVKIKNPSPYTFLGGAEEAETGLHSTFKANLEPGRYALATYYFAQAGMAEEFVIPEKGAASPVTNEPVNPPVTIVVTPQGTKVPQKLSAGRTFVTLEATKDKQGFYVLSRLKKDKSIEEFKQFWEDAYVYHKINPSQAAEPNIIIWSGPLTSDTNKTLNLDLQNTTYILTGPLPPQDQMPEQWKRDEMFHSFSVKRQ